MTNIAVTLIIFSALASVAIGTKYLLAKQFMPYQAAVAQVQWSEIPERLQAVILGMLKVVSAGQIAFGLSLGWLSIPLSRGEFWAIPAIFSLTVVNICIILKVTLGLQKIEPTAIPPTKPTSALFSIIFIALLIAYFK